MTRYFRLALGKRHCWHLKLKETFEDGSPIDIWAYCGGAVESPKPVPFGIQVNGPRVDYNPTAFLATVVSKRLAQLWESLGDGEIQRIPAVVDGDDGEWEVVCLLTCVDCIDHTKSKITYHSANDSENPGKPRGVLKLVIDPSRVDGHEIFQPTDWEVVTIVSEKVKEAMEAAAMTGVDFWLVSE